MKIITQFESVWDANLEQYVTITEESYDHEGDIAECKGGGKGGKGGVGRVLGIVASIAIPFAAPAIASSIGLSAAIGQVAASAVVGAGLGAVSAAVTGGDIGKGLLLGGFGGGAAGYAGVGAFPEQLAAPVADATITGVSGGAGLATGALDVVPAASGAVSGFDSMSGAYGPMPGGSNLMDYSLASQGMQGPMPGGSNLMDYSLTSQGVQGPEQQSFSDRVTEGATKTWDKMTSPDNIAKAGLQLGTQALGSALTDNGAADAYADSLKETSALNRDVYAFNKGQQVKKSDIGDQLNRDATSYDPNYFANQNATATGIAADNKWADYEQQMRAQGKDDQYIRAEKSRYGIQAGLNKSSAWDAGWQRGLNAQTGTRTAAGGMYGSVSGPADMTGSYAAYAQNSGKDATDFGYGLQKAFGIDYNTDAQKQKTEQTAKANYA